MSDILEIKSFERDGCICPDVSEIVKTAKFCAKGRDGAPASRRALPRFTVKVDGGKITTEREDTLKKTLCGIRPGSKCRVFRNSGWGSTIDFDNLKD